jgi:tight adherence protein B
MRIPFNLSLNSTTMLVAGGIFLLVLFVVVISMGRKSLSGAPGSQSVDDRLNQYAGRTDRNKAEEIKPLAKIDAAVSKGKQGSKIARDLARADLKLTVTEFIGLKILAAVAGAAAGAYIGRASTASMVLSAIVGGVLLSFAPNLYVGYAAKKRVKAFNNQLGDGITLMANSLRSGYSFLQSMDLVSREAPMPLSGEFRRVVQEIGLGLSSDEALGNLMRRIHQKILIC